MFVVTADQVSSRTGADLVPVALEGLSDLRERLAARPERTAGDEIQILTRSADVALEVVLRLTREGMWSVGLGVGAVAEPVPSSTREGSGPAYVSARGAVDRAKRRTTRFALEADPSRAEQARHVESLVDLLLALRERRTPEGWEVCDLVRGGRTQVEVARLLGITPQAVSLRLRIAGLRLEERAVSALVLLLDSLDRADDIGGGTP